MEISLSKEEWTLLKIVAGIWTAYQWWDILANFNEKFPFTVGLWRRLRAGDDNAQA